jgi:predicted ArsR family transcriptional regulator
MSGSDNLLKIPKSGRIGRFAKIVEEETGREVVEKVMQDADQYKSYNYVRKAAWWKRVIEELEKLIGREKSCEIMEKCGRKCCGPTSRKKAKEARGESESIEGLVKGMNENGIGGGRLTLKDETTVQGGYDHCYCGQVKHTAEVFPEIYCHCSVGWYKQLFESALGTPVEVELVQSIITGADTCEFIIHVKR